MPQSASMPAPQPDGFIKTLNSMGYMTSTLDPYSRAFIDFTVKAPGPALDIGAAYGIASLAALEQGATVVANDLDPRHLEILAGRVLAKDRDRLRLAPGAFPGELDFPDGSLGAALICRVLHFFEGPAIERAAAALFRWLAPGGKAFAVTETPYLRNFQPFIPVYESRKKLGERWPGLVKDVRPYCLQGSANLPRQMLFLDEDSMERTFREAGFIVEKVGCINRFDFPLSMRLDGRESVGIIARKPAALGS